MKFEDKVVATLKECNSEIILHTSMAFTRSALFIQWILTSFTTHIDISWFYLLKQKYKRNVTLVIVIISNTTHMIALGLKQF
jgi:hypothetical protein